MTAEDNLFYEDKGLIIDDCSISDDIVARYEMRDHIKELDALQFDAKTANPDWNSVLDLRRNNFVSQLGGKESIILISGASGTRKSTLLSSIIYSAYGDDVTKTLGFELNLSEHQWIFRFDTEQPKSDFDYQDLLVPRMLGRPTENLPMYKSFRLKGQSTRNRFESIEYMIHKYRDSLGVVIIDGIADLIGGVNDEVSSSELANSILKWGDVSGAMFILVLHTTESNTKKARGHLGSILHNKSGTHLNLTKHGFTDRTTVNYLKYRRSGKPKKIEFENDRKGFPLLYKPEGL